MESLARPATEEGFLDPRTDGWESEVVAERANTQLNRILGLLPHGDRIRSTDVTEDLAPGFQCNRLRPAKLVRVFGDTAITIRRETNVDGGDNTKVFRGAKGLAESLRAFAEPLRTATDVHVHVKIVRVGLETDMVRATALIEVSGRLKSDTIQQRDSWACRWKRSPDDSMKLVSIQASNYEEVTASGPEGVWFSDCTTAVLQDNRSFHEQLVFGLNHWLGRVERVHGIHTFARWGIALGDLNGDGLDDVYVCQPGGLPNLLYLHNPDGTATECAGRVGVDWLDHTSSALIVDLNNDGHQDLVVATTTGLVIMANNGAGGLVVRATLAPADNDPHSLSASDYDGDGDLDLYLCTEFANRQAMRNESSAGFVYHNTNDGGANLLFRNDIKPGANGPWAFTDVTRASGLDVNNRRHSLAASWEDYDNDGDPDLYVANDYGQNCLYRNDNGSFVDVAPEAGVVDFGSGMSASWGDYNRDGWMDLYVGNMFSAAGNRITRQERFKRGASEDLRAVYTRFAKGNSLFQNNASGKFQEVGGAAAVEMGRWAWSSVFADLNNDGWEDLLVANGYITTEDTGDL